MNDEKIAELAVSAETLTLTYLALSAIEYESIFTGAKILPGNSIRIQYENEIRTKLEQGTVPKLPTPKALKDAYVRKCVSHSYYNKQDPNDKVYYDPIERRWSQYQTVNPEEELWHRFATMVDNVLEREEPLPPVWEPDTPRPVNSDLVNIASQAATLTLRYLRLTPHIVMDIYDGKSTINLNEIQQYDIQLRDHYLSKLEMWKAAGIQMPSMPTEEQFKADYITRCLKISDYRIDTLHRRSFYDAMSGKRIYFPSPEPEHQKFMLQYFQGEVERQLQAQNALPHLQPEEEISKEIKESESHSAYQGLPSNYTASTRSQENDDDAGRSQKHARLIDPDEIKKEFTYESTAPPTHSNDTHAVLAFYQLKMRDYLRTMRRFMGLKRFFEGKEREHSYVSTTPPYNTIAIHEPYHIQSNRSAEREERLKKCMKLRKMRKLKSLGYVF